MTGIPSILSYSASGMTLLSCVTAALRGKYNSQKVFFLVSMLTASAVMLWQGLVLNGTSPGEVLGHFQILLALSIFFPGVALPFFTLFARQGGAKPVVRSIPGIAALLILLGGAAALIPVGMIVREVTFTDSMILYRVTFSAAGKGLAIVLVVANVFFLYSIENTYRAATVPAKVTLKYPVLGIFIASLLNLTVMGRVVSVSFLDPGSLALEACGMIVLAVTFIYADLRYPLFEVSARARSETNSVVSVVVAGLYILSIALVSYISAIAGLSFDRSGLYMLSIFAVFLLLATAISGNARRRLRRFLNENFYLGRYNYRREWRHYARLMSSSSSIEDLASNTISSLCETVMVRKGIIFIDIGGGRAATYGLAGEEWDIAGLREVLGRCPGEDASVMTGRTLRRSAVLEPVPHGAGGGGEPLRGGLLWAEALVFLRHDEDCRGFIALGRKDMSNHYTEEDRDFLSTVADQVMLTLDNLIMEEQVLEASRMESFNRFASFVIHDLKNTVGMLSLTAENARENISDESFQHDAIETINRSVEKMRGLIQSLSAHRSPDTIERKPVDVSRLALSKAESLAETASSRGVAIEVKTGKADGFELDPSALERVLENLVLNAVEASPPGGRVVIETGTGSDGSLTLDVTDNGPGFDSEYLRRGLFKPFSSTKKNGLGIGLVLCRSLVEAHGGRISISNTPGNGARVSVIIPGKR